MRSSHLILQQLDRSLRVAADHPPPAPPRGGWLKAVRTALGVSTRQLAARLGATHSAIVQAEKSEAGGSISLAQLRRRAEALDCELHYVLIPRTPLAERVDAQADRKARERVATISHTMTLEAQDTGNEFQRQQIAAAKDELLRGRRSRLWD